MGNISSKYNNTTICITSPFELKFKQVSEEYLSGFIYRFFVPKRIKKITHSCLFEPILKFYININDKSNKNTHNIRETFEMDLSITCFKSVTTKNGKRLENKAYLGDSTIILRLDINKKKIRELVYVSKHKFDQT